MNMLACSDCDDDLGGTAVCEGCIADAEDVAEAAGKVEGIRFEHARIVAFLRAKGAPTHLVLAVENGEHRIHDLAASAAG